MGWIGILIIVWFPPFLKTIRNETGTWTWNKKQLFYLLYFLTIVSIVIAITIADIMNFLFILGTTIYPDITMILTGRAYTFVLFPLQRGTPYLSHIFGLMTGMIIRIYSKESRDGQTMEKIMEWERD
ncbi:MAG: hypothetical protein ACXAEU_11395 [Candidatus Hodarchaeales archaeon]|jgi:hypothetical protein